MNFFHCSVTCLIREKRRLHVFRCWPFHIQTQTHTLELNLLIKCCYWCDYTHSACLQTHSLKITHSTSPQYFHWNGRAGCMWQFLAWFTFDAHTVNLVLLCFWTNFQWIWIKPNLELSTFFVSIYPSTLWLWSILGNGLLIPITHFFTQFTRLRS